MAGVSCFQHFLVLHEDSFKMTIALIDSDIVAYRSAASCEPSKARAYTEPLEVAIQRADELMHRIMQDTEASSQQSFLTGSNNFRTKINPEYKANRKDKPRPQWLQPVREFLVTQWQAKVEDEQEADDALGIEQCAAELGSTIIVSIDKDLLCIPGRHYNFVTGDFYEQDSISATRHFYYQLLLGDGSDNIFGFDGLARQKVPQKLEHVFNELGSYNDESDMFSFVRGLYNDDKRLLMNGQCLYIRREPDQIWQFPS